MSEPWPFRVIVTGSRWVTADDAALVRSKLRMVCGPALTAGRPVVIVEGRCPRGGVDLVAQCWAEETPGVTDEGHPADWKIYGRAAGNLRNTVMVQRGGDMFVAFPSPESSGTWDCVRKAARAGIPGRVYPIVGRDENKIETIGIPGVST